MRSPTASRTTAIPTPRRRATTSSASCGRWSAPRCSTPSAARATGRSGPPRADTVERARFVTLVRRALRDIPPPFKDHLRQVDIVVKRRPSRDDLLAAALEPGESMYGFYRGVPLTERGSGYNLVAPDVIQIYQEPLEEDFRSEAELMAEIRRTVLHEIAHFFGIDDDRLDELGRG